MKIGDYVRTREGIAKIEKIRNELIILDTELDLTAEFFGNQYLKKEIIKSSPNLIDLIEAGDYVNGKLVIEHAYQKGRLFVTNLYVGGKGFTTCEDYSLELTKEDEDRIETIVTKEQFESMEYRIG